VPEVLKLGTVFKFAVLIYFNNLIDGIKIISTLEEVITDCRDYEG